MLRANLGHKSLGRQHRAWSGVRRVGRSTWYQSAQCFLAKARWCDREVYAYMGRVLGWDRAGRTTVAIPTTALKWGGPEQGGASVMQYDKLARVGLST